MNVGDETHRLARTPHPGAFRHFAPGVPFPECAAIACTRLGIDATYGFYDVPTEGTPEQVRADVRRCLLQAGQAGGLILQCGDGQIMPDCPLENVVAYLDEAHRG